MSETGAKKLADSKTLGFIPRTLIHATPEGAHLMVNGVLWHDSDAESDVDSVVIIIGSLVAGLVCCVGLFLGLFVYLKKRRTRDECEQPFHESIRGYTDPLEGGQFPPPPAGGFGMSQNSLSALPPPLTAGTLSRAADETAQFLDIGVRGGHQNYGIIGSVRRPSGADYSSLPITNTLRQRPVHNDVVYDRVLERQPSEAVSHCGRAPPPAAYSTNSTITGLRSSTISSTSSTKDYTAIMNGHMDQRRPQTEDDYEEDSF